MSESGETVLYDHAASPCARRVRPALIEKGVRWRSRPIDLERVGGRPSFLRSIADGGGATA